MNQDKLQGKEKIMVWVANLVNPILAGFLFYYSWRKAFPNKAKQANSISFLVFGIEAVIYVLWVFYKTKPIF